jgi:hypothetical protein
MTSTVLSLAASLALGASPPPAAPALRPEPPRDVAGSAERDALRALAAHAAGEPGISEVQEAAARASDRSGGEARGFALRARVAALLPRLTAEYRREERSYRTYGLQGSGEVDYLRSAPGNAVVLRATWDLGGLVAARDELAAASAERERARRRGAAVARASAVFYELRRARLALLLAPPDTALALAEAELEVDQLGAELDALTGGLLSRRRR